MLSWLELWLGNDDTKVVYVLTLILVANILDFLMGWLNARFNENVKFSSSKAIFGIARKMVMFILLVFFIPVSLLVPEPIGISALYVLFGGYLFSEINSILSHLKIGNDDKSVDMFADFVKNMMMGKEDEK